LDPAVIRILSLGAIWNFDEGTQLPSVDLCVMGLSNNPTCKKCGTEEETSLHILWECEALASLRHIYPGSLFLDPRDIKVPRVGAIWNFVKGTGLL